MSSAAESVELYIHIPFCEKKCAYCDFLSFPASESTKKEYVGALIEEIRHIWCGLPVSTVYIGGGTPSVLPAEDICSIMDTVRECYSFAGDPEISIEANPGTVDIEKLRAYRGAGINRVSFGCQSFNDRELESLSRIHRTGDIVRSVSLAREAGFDNVNLDLMYGLPGQTAASWEHTLRSAAELSPEHISAYSLIIEEGTPFFDIYGDSRFASDMTKAEAAARARSREDAGEEAKEILPLPDEDAEREMNDMAADILREAGYGQYEISNYARVGHECRHNVGYWTGVPYIGFGIGASSYLPKSLAADSIEESEEETWRSEMSSIGGDDMWNSFAYDSYEEEMTSAWDSGPGEDEDETGAPERWVRYSNTDNMLSYTAGIIEHTGFQMLKERDLEAEFMILGLRMTDGVEDEEFRRRFRHSLDSSYGRVIDKYVRSGHMVRGDGRTRLTRGGLAVSNSILVDFLP